MIAVFITEMVILFKHIIIITIIIIIGNSMICSDIWHKYHGWYFEIVIRNFTSPFSSEIWGNFEISPVVFMPNITYKSCYYLLTLYYYPQKVCNFHM